jgi:hypothetical protein
MIFLKRMPHNPVKSSRNLLFGGILLFAIVGFAATSTTVVKISLSAVILVLVAFAEAGLIIFGLSIVQNSPEASVTNQENA